MRRSISTLLVLTLLAPSPAGAGPLLDCLRPGLNAVLKELAPVSKDESLRQAITKQLGLTLRQTGQAFVPKNKGPFIELMTFPVMGPYAFLKEGKATLSEGGAKSLWKVPFRFVQKKGGIVTGVVFLAYVQGRLTIDQVDFDEETSEFTDQLGKKPYVLVSMMDSEDYISDVPEYDFRKSMSQHPGTHFLKVKSFAEMKRKLSEIEKNEGPIYGLEIYTHGLPGELYHADDSLAPELRRMVEAKQSIVLADGAKIKINSCLTGLGDKGEAFVQDIGSVFLPGGGTVFSARVSIMSNKQEAVDENRSLEDKLSHLANSVFKKTSAIQTLMMLGTQFDTAIDSGSAELGVVNRVRTTRIPASR